MRGRCAVHTPPSIAKIKFTASEMTSLEQLKKKNITVQSRMMFATNPSSPLISGHCLVASVMTKMNASSWRKDRVAILYEVQVGNRIYIVALHVGGNDIFVLEA